MNAVELEKFNQSFVVAPNGCWLWTKGKITREIAKELQLPESTVSAIRKGRIFSHITGFPKLERKQYGDSYKLRLFDFV